MQLEVLNKKKETVHVRGSLLMSLKFAAEAESTLPVLLALEAG